MKYDAIVIGSGPNGLTAAIRMAQKGQSVKIFEAASHVGGGMHSAELTLPGFIHDVCSGVHPLGIASPFFRSLNLEKFGLRWIHSPAAVAHPLYDGAPVLLLNSVEETAENLGEDGESYRRIMKPLADHWEEIFADSLRPLLRVPDHPFLLARFGLKALQSAETFINHHFHHTRARALLGGIASHVNTPLNGAGTAGAALMLNLAAHARGWPVAEGGSQNLARALARCFQSLGGEIETGREIHRLSDLPPAKFVFFDIDPMQIASILGEKIRPSSQNKLTSHKFGAAVFKLDWALSEPIPWSRPETSLAATVHLGGTLEEMIQGEALPSTGKVSEKPFVLLSQPSLFDSTRAPSGQHTAWAYCHVPQASNKSMTEIIEDRIEEFAPGFKTKILKRSILSPLELQRQNRNLIGGDISGGIFTLARLFFGPYGHLHPYKLPLPGHYICSSSTPPGPGVHGMCGFYAAEAALRDSSNF